MRLIKREAKGVMKPGQELVAAGYTGMEGARRIALVREKELLGWFSQDYVRQIQEKETFIIGDNLTPWREPGRAVFLPPFGICRGHTCWDLRLTSARYL